MTSHILDPGVPQIHYQTGLSFAHEDFLSALAAAENQFGEQGHVADLPTLIRGRLAAPFDHLTWQRSVVGFSQEFVIMDPTLAHGDPSKEALMIYHGCGPLTLDSLPKAAMQKDGSLRLTREQVTRAISGRLATGRVDVFDYDSFTNVAEQKMLPQHYACRLPFHWIKQTPDGELSLDLVASLPLYVARMGGPLQAQAYVAKLADSGVEQLTVHHPYRDATVRYSDVRFLTLGAGTSMGVCGVLPGEHTFVAVCALERRLSPESIVASFDSLYDDVAPDALAELEIILSRP